MKVTIIGVNAGQTKNQRNYYRYYFSKPFADYDIENSECRGEMTGSEFSYKHYNVEPGDECDFQYEPGFEGKAVLSDIIVLKPAGGVPFDKDKGKENSKQ